MAEYNIDDPLSQSISHLKYESRRRRFEKRLAQSKCQREERDRVRKIKCQWEREDLSGRHSTAKNGTESDDERKSDSSTDLMESPPATPKRKYQSSKKANRHDRRSRNDSDSSHEQKGHGTAKKASYLSTKIKSTTKRSITRPDLREDSDSDSIGQARKENALNILKPDGHSLPTQPVEKDTVNTNSLSSMKREFTPKLLKKPRQTESSDESEVDFEFIRRQRQETQQKLAIKKQQPLDTTPNILSTTRLLPANENSKTENIPSKLSVKFSPKVVIKKKHRLAYASSSSEDEAITEARLRKRFEDKQKHNSSSRPRERYSSSSNEAPKKFQKEDTNHKNVNRYSSSSSDTPKRFKHDNPSTSSQVYKRSRHTQAESSSEDEIELENRFRKSFEEKRLAAYKRNPLSMAKKDDDDWRVRMENQLSRERLVGKDILVECKKEIKENVSDLGGSQERPDRRKRGRVPLIDSHLAFAKNQSIDDTKDVLWDDSDNERVIKGGNNDSGGKSKNKERKSAKAKDDDDRQNPKPNKRSHLPKMTDDDLILPQLPQKRPSPSNYTDNAPIGRKRKGRIKGKRNETEKDESDSSIVSDEEESRLLSQLKPNFTNPALGPPGPLEPFLLSKGDDDINRTAAELENESAKHQVPASINRYLQDYQREGIQFMYSSVNERKGCVLGHDMGLGKTVQVISLIAALQHKTGTGLDNMKIKCLRRDIAKAMEKATKAQLDKRLGINTDVDVDRFFDEIERLAFAPILVIVPSSVIQNWVNEFETWGHFNVSVYQGASREKALDEVAEGSNSIMITGKTLITRESDFTRFKDIEWKAIFVDEYHEYKNPKSQAHQCVLQLRDEFQCPIVGLTGTLMQNNHDELHALIDLVRPGALEDRKSFMEYISKPIKLARTKDAKEEIKRLGKQREEELMRTIAPFFIERKKDDVLKDSLTSKNEKVMFCELSELQKKLYRHILSLPDYDMLRMGGTPCGGCGINQQYFIGYNRLKTRKERMNYQRRHKLEIVPRKQCCFKFPYEGLAEQEPGDKIDNMAILWIQKHKKIVKNPNALPAGTEVVEMLDNEYGLVSCKNCPMCTGLSAMSKLHKVCSHPSLLQVVRTALPGAETDKKLEFAKIAFRHDILDQLPGRDYYRSDGIMDDHLKLSGKMKTLDYCLRRFIRKRDRVLVFSYSTATLDLIQQHVKTQGWTHLRLDGQTPTSTRQSLVDTFQKDETISLFLISTRAGGLGLNLTAANKVIIFDVNWNPSYDEQAQDRSYRIGQANDVEVIRLVARGTIEEIMFLRQVYKVQLKKQTLGGTSGGKNQPEIFKGVDKDKNRKGELFGIENLLKFIDGSFTQRVWKKKNESKKKIDPNEAHDVCKISFTEKDVENAIEEECICDESINSDSEDEFGKKVKASGINHGDFFNVDRGKARYNKGDDESDEEMGGASQMMYVATNMIAENFESDTSEENATNDHNENTQSVQAHAILKSIDETIGLRPSPIKSSTACCGGAIEHHSVTSPPFPSKKETSNPHMSQPPHVDLTAKTAARSKVSIMGAVFEESKTSQDGSKQRKTPGFYIPSYSRVEK